MNEVKGWCGKKTSGIVSSFQGTILFCAVRMLLCALIGGGIILLSHDVNGFSAGRVTLASAAVAGIASATFVSSWLIAVRNGSYMMVDVFLTLGVAVPLAGCRIVYGEPLMAKQFIGMILLVLAAIVLSSYNTSIGKSKLTLRSMVTLMLCGLANGTGSFCQKIFSYESIDSVYVYNFYTYVFSFIALIVVLMITFSKHRNVLPNKANAASKLRLSGYLFIMSLSMFLNTLFITMAAKQLPASELYPLTQGGILVMSMIMSAVFFGEKITKKCVIGCMMVFAALLLINL